MITMPATAENGNREATILIRVCGIRLAAELDRSSTARAMITALPFEGRVNIWGQEIYFEIPVELPLAADASAELAVGDVAYWPQGRAMCIFFGPTPASVDDAPRAYSPVNRFGRVAGDATLLNKVADGAAVTVTLQTL